MQSSHSDSNDANHLHACGLYYQLIYNNLKCIRIWLSEKESFVIYDINIMSRDDFSCSIIESTTSLKNKGFYIVSFQYIIKWEEINIDIGKYNNVNLLR